MTSLASGTTLPAPLEKVVQRFQRLAEPKQRYELLIWFAKRLKEFPEADKVAENKVPGCVSQVFVTAILTEGSVTFAADSDSQLTKGLAAVLVEGLSGLTPEAIAQLSPNFIELMGLSVSLTPSRSNGFYNMFKTMQAKAIQLKDT
jgi:cysteine desulfuration protein SufE